MAYIADLSKWQGNIDFGKLKSQVDFVILRVQAGYSTHDLKYKEYVAGCKANGIPFGTYAYFKGVSIPDSIAEAKCAMELTDSESEFFALDIEDNSMNDLVGGGQAFIDYLKNKGMQKVGLYSGEYFYTKHNLSAIKCDFTWLASYGKNDGQPHNKPKVNCDLWQYTSMGKLEGIAGNVDLNVLSGSKPLEYFTGNIKQEPGFIMTVRVECETDVRAEPSHKSGFIKNAHKGETYNVIRLVNDWHEIAVDNHTKGWIDGNNGHNLYWLDNPRLK
jgi:GH25 family lysozyme M1 (1,4-beta-N-acetylmuramidase)